MRAHARPRPIPIRFSCAAALTMLCLAASCGLAGAAGAAPTPQQSPLARGTVLADFESGQVTLGSYPGEDLEPDGWELTQANTHGGSLYSLRLTGNTWKTQPISPYPIVEGTVFQVAVFGEQVGEVQAFGVTDGTNTLFYTFYGTELPTTTSWEVAYQGAFPDSTWNLYLLPVGRDWRNRFGYDPSLTALVYVNDRDLHPRGLVLFDDVIDVTADLPIAPTAEIVRGREKVERIGEQLYRVGIQFHAQVHDPDSQSWTYLWDFGDSTTSALQDPYHEFLVRADHTFTVDLAVRDEAGLWGRDSAQVAVDPGLPSPAPTVNFVGDIMLGRGYDSQGGFIDTYGVNAIFTPTLPIFGQDADVNICNLECSFTDEGIPHPTKSVVFRARPANVAGLVYAGVELVSLANNHIIDYGQRGMEETLEVLDANSIRWSGAGDNDYIALQPSFWNEQGIAMAFVQQCNRTGREYNYQPFLDAAYDKPGFAWLTQPNLDDAVAEARPLADLVVCQLHSGIEYQPRPPETLFGVPAAGDLDPEASLVEPPVEEMGLPANADFRFPTRPSMTDRQLRWRAVEDGADLVINHHPHVLQGFEVYQGVLIAHSLGNYVFDLSYAETLPTIVLKAEFDKDGFHKFTYRPAFIDHWVPKPATGRVGREILDRMADYSREMNTVVTVDPVAVQGRIWIDPAQIDWAVTPAQKTAPLVHQDAWWVTPPIERTGAGVLSGIVAVEGAGGTVQVRVGREILWHGDMESEGSSQWDLNTSDEVYDTGVRHQGLRSVRQHRTSSNTGPVTTDLLSTPATLGRLQFSVCGWLKTQDAKDAGFMARMFRGQGSGLLGSFESGPLVNGTQDWRFQWADFVSPDQTAYFNVRPHMEKPDSGESWAWYDELRLVEWEDWSEQAMPYAVAYPSNLRFLQVRVSQQADSVRLRWEERSAQNASSGIAEGRRTEERRSNTLFLARPEPNPARGAFSLAYRTSYAAHVRLAVFDVSGRQVAVLADGPQEPGTHRVAWDARTLASGLYFCRLEAGDDVRTEKLIVLR